MSLNTNKEIAKRICRFSEAKWPLLLIAVEGIERAGCWVQMRILPRKVLLATEMRIILITKVILLSLRILIIVI